MVSQKISGRAVSMPMGIARGVAAGGILLTAFLAVLAKMILAEIVAEQMIGYGIMITLLTASCLGAMVSMHAVKHRNLMTAFLTGVSFLLVLYAATVLLFDGQFDGVLVSSVLVICGSLLGLVFQTSLSEGKSSHPRRRRR